MVLLSDIEKATERLNRAVAMGVISQAEADAQIAALRSEYETPWRQLYVAESQAVAESVTCLLHHISGVPKERLRIVECRADSLRDSGCRVVEMQAATQDEVAPLFEHCQYFWGGVHFVRSSLDKQTPSATV